LPFQRAALLFGRARISGMNTAAFVNLITVADNEGGGG